MSDWPITINANISWLSISLTFLLLLALRLVFKLQSEKKQIEHRLSQLENQFLAMNSGHLGMGREIKKVIKGIASVEEMQQLEGTTEVNEKTYDQAGLLLARGATIEEVVEACQITPAEAELLAIMRHSAPSHQKREASQVA